MTMDEVRGRLLAVDLGQKRVGFAVSDPTGHFAVGLETLTVYHKTDVVGEVVARCKAYGVETVILGLPRNMNGSEGPQAEKVRAFGDALVAALGEAGLGCGLEFLDERLTSVLAHQTLREQGIAPSRHKGWVDQAAAKRILQDYMDREAARARFQEKEEEGQ